MASVVRVKRKRVFKRPWGTVGLYEREDVDGGWEEGLSWWTIQKKTPESPQHWANGPAEGRF